MIGYPKKVDALACAVLARFARLPFSPASSHHENAIWSKDLPIETRPHQRTRSSWPRRRPGWQMQELASCLSASKL